MLIDGTCTVVRRWGGWSAVSADVVASAEAPTWMESCGSDGVERAWLGFALQLGECVVGLLVGG